MRRRLVFVVRAVCLLVGCAAALWQILLLVRLFLKRVGYPMDIEWLESAALYQAYRFMHGQSTFGPPQNGFLPLFHPPGLMTALALAGHVFGLDYAVGRSVAFGSFVAVSCLAVGSVVKHEENRLDGWAMGLVAVACGAAGVPMTESFYDLIRADTIALFLCVSAALLALERKMKTPRIVAIALLMTAVLYSRFPYAFMLVWIVLFVLVRNRRAGLLLSLTTISACGLMLVLLQFLSKGWFWMYTIALYQDHKISSDRIVLGLKLLWEFAPFIVAIPLVTVVLAFKKRLSPRTVLWVGLLLFAIPSSFLPFIKVGGYSNDLIPLAFLVGPATVFLASDGFQALAAWPRLATGLRCAFYVVAAIFLYLRIYPIDRYLPSADFWARSAALNQRLASLQGGVIIPRHPFMATRNGDRTPQFADMPYLDAAWTNFTNLNLGAYIDKAHPRWAMVSGTEVRYTAGELAGRYQLDSTLNFTPGTVIGERSVLRYLLRWQDEEPNPRVVFDFEQGNLDGWAAVGEAFVVTSTTNRIRGQSQVLGIIDKHFVNSFHPVKRDAAMGTLTSPIFIIDRPNLAFRLGGGPRMLTRIELQINGRTVRKASSVFKHHEVLLKQVWDVSQFINQQARIVLIDQDDGSWGHLLCDQIVLY